MNNLFRGLSLLFCASIFFSCSQSDSAVQKSVTVVQKSDAAVRTAPHKYGGWYCPDNLNGFPAVDIQDWENVPVVVGRMPTQEEAWNGTSLIYVDPEKYPSASPLDIDVPKLARFHNYNTAKDEIIIVIQAVNISNDSIVGFRYLNGGNGSARLSEVTFLSENEISEISISHFVSLRIEINATQKKVFDVITKPEYLEALTPTFDSDNLLDINWYTSSKINFKYLNSLKITSDFAGLHFGSYYIQIDAKLENYQYVEKFLLLEDESTNSTELIITCGPYIDDFEGQKFILRNWANKVKELSEE
jgi:hypothetical protein